MLDREQLETFATVSELGSFDRAAMTLNLTRGAVSQRIKALEESLATVLLVRDKPVRPTAHGETLLRHVHELRLLEGALLKEMLPLQRQPGSVPVAIAVNADSLIGWFAPILNSLLLDTVLALEIVSDDQDHTFARMARGEVLGCISSEATALPGFLVDSLGDMVYRCVAAPGFAQRAFPSGFDLQAVLGAPAILFDRKDGLHDDFLAEMFGFRIHRYVRNYIPSPHALFAAVCSGGGYGLVPESQAAPLLAHGGLVDLAPTRPKHVPLYWHRRDREATLASEITRRVVAQARLSLVQRTLAAAAA